MLYYNFPVITEELKKIKECHHIELLRCSKAKELLPDQCINDRKCELYLNQELLFHPVGIDVKALQALDNALRGKKQL